MGGEKPVPDSPEVTAGPAIAGEPPAGDDKTNAGSLDGLALGDILPGIDGFVFLLDREGHILDFRMGSASELFAPAGEFLGKSVGEVLPDDAAEQILAVLRTVAPGESPVVPYSLPFPDGTRAFEACIVALTGGLCIALVSHVTRRVQAEEALRASDEQLRAILAAEPECVNVVSPDGMLLEINPAGLEMLEEPSLASAQRHPLVDYVVPAQREAYLELLRGVLGGGQGSLELEVTGARGRQRWLEVNAVPLRDADGAVTAMLAISRDVSARRIAEEALRENEERLAEAVRVGMFGIFDHDHETDVIYWSPQQRANYGWDPNGDEIVTLEKFLRQVFPEDHERINRAVQRAHDPSGDGRFDVEHRIIRRDSGETRWVVTRSATFFAGEGSARRATRTVGAVVDITDRLQLEQRVLQAERLDSIGRLAGGIAHDFNNLLTAILGFAQLIEEDSSQGPVNVDDLHEIQAAARRAQDLTSQLLAFARRQVISPRPTDLNEILRNAARILDQLVGEDVELTMSLAEPLWPIHVDPSQIEQVILNLAVNARDAMPAGGKLTLETENVELTKDYAAGHADMMPGPHVMVAVSDTGLGISTTELARIFEPFYTTKAIGEGTGLGLATVYGIVRQNDGSVWVYSEPGIGTTFKIYLPRAKDALATATRVEPRPSRAAIGTETLLVVEDDESVRALTARALREAGYKVLVAASPHEALMVARSTATEISGLVTDVVMPGMSGKTLADALHVERPSLPVLYVSGYTQNTIGHHGVIQSGVEFLAKPFTPAQLRERVRDILDSPPPHPS